MHPYILRLLISISLLAPFSSLPAGAPPLLESLSTFATRAPAATRSKAHQAASARVSVAYAKLPLSFEANQGQSDARVKFLSRGGGYSLFLLRNADFGMRNQEGSAVRVRLMGGNPAPRVAALEPLPGKSNYFLGNDPKEWHTNVPQYGKVRYENVYPGVSLIYYGNQRQLEYDFVLAPGADPKSIRLAVEGADRLELDARGDLVLDAQGGEVRLHKPLVYQETKGVRKEVGGAYTVRGNHQVGFAVAAYDVRQPLIIDPVLVYSSYAAQVVLTIGGASSNTVTIAVQ